MRVFGDKVMPGGEADCECSVMGVLPGGEAECEWWVMG